MENYLQRPTTKKKNPANDLVKYTQITSYISRTRLQNVIIKQTNLIFHVNCIVKFVLFTRFM